MTEIVTWNVQENQRCCRTWSRQTMPTSVTMYMALGLQKCLPVSCSLLLESFRGMLLKSCRGWRLHQQQSDGGWLPVDVVSAGWFGADCLAAECICRRKHLKTVFAFAALCFARPFGAFSPSQWHQRQACSGSLKSERGFCQNRSFGVVCGSWPETWSIAETERRAELSFRRVQNCFSWFWVVWNESKFGWLFWWRRGR